METYNTFGFVINITDDKLLSQELKQRLVNNVWEENEVEAAKYVGEDANVLELGGCLGIASIAINKRLSDPKQHVVLEPNPKLIPHMEKIRDDNNCGYSIVDSFLSTKDEVQDFSLHPTHIMGGKLGRIGGYEIVKIQSKTIENLEKEHNIVFDTIVMDIEHGEYILYDQGFFTKEHLPNINFMMIELHSSPLKAQLRNHLSEMFDEEITITHSHNNSVFVYRNN